MKKTAALLFCFIISTVCFNGCTDSGGTFAQKRYTPEAEGITEVYVDARDRQIEVIVSADNQIHIDYFENGKESYDISVTDGHILTMAAVNKKNWTDYIGGKSPAASRNITLHLPDALLIALSLSTTNEDISLPALAVARDVSLVSHGGNLIFDNLSAGNSIYLESKNGDISGTIIGSYEDYAISCVVKKGESNLPPNKEEGAKTLAVSNNNGDIAIAFAKE